MKARVFPTLVAIFASAIQMLGQPSVLTDHADYSPGSTVSISGTGFQPAEAVRLQILRIDVPDNNGPEHQPWQVNADDQGDFLAAWLVTSHEAGATLELTATGLASGLTAQTVFTDAAITPASGGEAISADTYGTGYTVLTGPVITETVNGDINTGTIVLTLPPGFAFDTNAPLPVITLAGDAANKNINNLTNGSIIPLTVTTNKLSFTVTAKSNGQVRNTLTYSNIRVRPVAATPLASGNITNTGTSVFLNSTTNFGTLTEVAGAITWLAVSGFPSPQTAGSTGSVTVTAQDQFGNTAGGYTGRVHFSSTDAQAVLPADYTFAGADNGSRTFSGVTLKTAGTQSITASNTVAFSFSGTQAGISVNATAADRLAFVTQPGSATYGSLLSPQPMLKTRDSYGNDSVVGIGTSKTVSLALSSGSGPLAGAASLDIGTGAGNGTVTFTNLKVSTAGLGKQLTTSASGLSNALSSSFTVNQASLTASVTVSNKIYNASTGASIATRALTGVIGADDVTLIGGTAAFATKTVANGKTVTVTGLGLSGASAGNYALASTTATTTANIAPAALAVRAAAASKGYDGNTTESVTLSDNRLGGDSLTISYTAATFADKNVGDGKTVTVTGISLTGPDALNYTANTTAACAADITPAPLMVTANCTNRAWGQPNPNFSATIAGFVNSEGTSVLSGTLALTTPAGTTSPPADYPIIPSGLASANYSITFSNGILTVTSTNQLPVLAGITNLTVRPGQAVVLNVHASDPNGDQLSFCLDAGAPAGAVITNLAKWFPQAATNAVFRWCPTRAQSSTTNLITIRVTDNGQPPMSAAQTLTVVVLDYLDITIGSTNVESGESVAVPVYLASSDGVTNLNCNIRWPSSHLSTPVLAAMAPGVASASLQDQGASLLLSLQTAPGQVLQGTQQVAQLSFAALSNPDSAFVPLAIDSASAVKPDGSLYVNYVTPEATVAVVEGTPLLSAFLLPDYERRLTLYGRVGTSYELQYSTNLAFRDAWASAWSYVQTNGAMTIGVDSAHSNIFYRIFKP